MSVQIIEKADKKKYAVIPYSDYLALLERAEDAEDIRAAAAAVRALAEGEDELVPGDVVDALMEGEHPVKVWRRHRGLSQAQLAERIGATQGSIAQIENRLRAGSVDTLARIAQALEVDLDDLATAWG